MCEPLCIVYTCEYACKEMCVVKDVRAVRIHNQRLKMDSKCMPPSFFFPAGSETDIQIFK